MPLEQQPPIVLAMILADTVLLDVATGKNVIHGTYQALEAATFPFTHPSIVVYVVLKVVFPEPGEYRLQLFVAGEPLLERRLQVGPEADPNPS